MSLFSNASPESINLGTDDQSKKVASKPRSPIPQHVPLVFIYSAKGPTKADVYEPAELPNIFGSETFDHDSPFYKHTTRFLSYFSSVGIFVQLKE